VDDKDHVENCNLPNISSDGATTQFQQEFVGAIYFEGDYWRV